ncbi:Hypothetical predicted protein [Octopus vulgaris]|uniref:HTH CENPB-type domain-containing protein n=1 Tax=Octopus vulgaris TaxID=6645 RepID=A0AA36BGM3_OCTVU|nr:Hypothetical predicted protein [Octopus vulgaris]
MIVRRADLQEFAFAMATQLDLFPEIFKVSIHWLDNFLWRYELSLRRSTTLFKLEDAEVIQRALAFKSFIDGIDFSKYNLSNIIAMDETAVFMGQGSKMTIEQTGTSSIYIASTGYESTRVTCILAIHLNETKVSLLTITKGKTKKRKWNEIQAFMSLKRRMAWCTQVVIKKMG